MPYNPTPKHPPAAPRQPLEPHRQGRRAPLNPTQQSRVADAPERIRGILTRAYSGQSRAAGLKAFCLQCVGYVRKDVRDCTAEGCPLFPYRPYQVPGELEAEEAAQECSLAPVARANDG